MTVPKLEALVGHLFIVGGKTIHNAPPGARVELPPRRVHRSREDDTLFVLITAAGRKQMPAELFDELAKLGAETYFRSKGGVTGALRDGVAAINAKLYNGEYRAGAVLLAKRKEDVYVARCGSTLVAVRGQEGYSTFPSDPELLNMFPLGSQSEPMLEFTRYPLGAEDIFVLGDAGFATITDKVLEACIAKGNIEQILDQLETVVTKQATATVIQFVLPEGEVMAVGGDTSRTTPTPAPSLAPTLATPAPTTPPNVSMSPSASPATPSIPPSHKGEVAPASSSPVSAPVAMLAPALEVAVDEEETPKPETAPVAEAGFLSYSTDDTTLEEGIVEAPAEKVAPASEADEVPEETPASPEEVAEYTQTQRTQRKPKPMQTIAEKPKASPRPNPAAQVLRASGRGLSTGINRLLPETEDAPKARETVPFNVMLMIAVFIPAVIAVIVVGFTISDKGNTIFERQREDAIQAYDEALAYSAQPNADRKTARDLWAIAKGHASEALRVNSDDNQIIEIFKASQVKLDEYDRVRRVEVVELHTFGANADLRGPIVGNGIDMYVLDHNRSAVYHLTLNSGGDKILEREDQPIIERGMPIRTDIVSNLVDIVWMDDGGAAQDNAIVALDENGMLISYSPVYAPANGLKLTLPPAWNRPVAVTMWRQNFYVLDAGANQIWRFVAVDGYYNQVPDEYFAGGTQPDLGEAVDFSIDSDGAVYILFQDGHIDKYIGGEPEVFNIVEGPVDGLSDVRALYLDPNPLTYGMYMGAAGNEAVYQVSLGGRINDGYRPANPPLNAFKDVTGVFGLDKNVYVLAGSKLYYLAGQ